MFCSDFRLGVATNFQKLDCTVTRKRGLKEVFSELKIDDHAKKNKVKEFNASKNLRWTKNRPTIGKNEIFNNFSAIKV